MPRFAAVVVSAIVVAGCIDSRLVDCGDGTSCPQGTVCATLSADGARQCPSQAQVAACSGQQPYALCMTPTVPTGACYDSDAGLVCLPSGCGNGLVDPQLGEVCDDGNDVIGDGCSYDCKSNETCGNGYLDPVKLVGGEPVANETCDDGNLVAHDGCSSLCALETPAWTALEYGQPPVEMQVMVSDPVRGRILMFGGENYFTIRRPPVANNGTYEWDGAGWEHKLVSVAPASRTQSAAAYDSARHRAVLFSGQGTLADTWEWDGASWSIIVPAQSPPGRGGHGMAFDPVRKLVVMYGGNDGVSNLGDTWTWDGQAWAELAGEAPPARANMVMAYDPARGAIVMAGGTTDGTTPLLDTWLLDASGWHQVDPGMTTPPLVASAIGWDPINQQLITFGGLSQTTIDGYSQETWGWDGQRWQMLASAGPLERAWTALATDYVRGQVVMFGGEYIPTCGAGCAPSQSDMWSWNGTAWVQLSPAGTPPGLSNSAVAYDPIHARLLVFGGIEPISPGGDTWMFSAGHWDHVATTGPSAQQGAAMAYDPVNDQFLLVGSDPGTWIFADGAWQQSADVSFPGASNGAMAYDAAARVVVLFDGGNTWEWNGSTWDAQPASSNVPGLAQPGMVYDPIDQHVALVAGDVWEWDHAQRTWVSHATATSPGQRSGAGAVWSGARRSILLFGGYGQDALNDAWEWNGSDWRLITTNPITAVSGPIAAPSADGAGMFLYGGSPGIDLGSVTNTERLEWSNGATSEACTANVDLDGDGLAGCADPDCWVSCAPMCPPGAVCDPTWPHCGDGACNTALENCHLCPQDCGPCTAICGDSFCDPPEDAASCPGDCGT